MRKLLTLTAALALAAGVTAQAQQASQQTPPAQTKPEEKPKPEESAKADAKAAPSVAGKWTMAVDMQGNVMNSGLELKLDGKKVTGTISSQQGDPAAVQGEFADGKLTFSMTFNGQNGPIQINFNGAFKENGTLAGTMDFGPAGQGMQINWTAERVKEK